MQMNIHTNNMMEKMLDLIEEDVGSNLKRLGTMNTELSSDDESTPGKGQSPG